MTAKELPAVDYLRKRLRCDPAAGKLFWLDCAEMSYRWRTRYAGKEAFTTVSGNGYLYGSVNSVKMRAHRVIWALCHGEQPSDQIDHINGIRTDNRIENLRVVSRQENMRNTALLRNNTSGVCGVSWNKARGKWLAHIKIDGRLKNIGLFDRLEDAAVARAEASARYGFTKRHGT